MKTKLILLTLVLSTSLGAQQWQWGQQFFPSYADRSVKMTADSEGNSIFCGTFKGGLQVWGGDSMFDVSRQNYYIAKADALGNPVWAIQPITKLEDFGLVGTFYDIDSDEAGNIYIAGTFVDSIRIGDKQVFSVHADSMDNSQMYYAKLSPAGECIYLQNADSKQYSWCTDISHQNGRTYISGTYRDTITIAGQQFDSGARFGTAFMAEIDDQGEVIWLKRLPSISIMEADENGIIHTAGSFSDSIRLGGILVESNFRRNFYYAQYNLDGELITESVRYGYVGTNENSDRITLNDIAIDQNGEVNLTGSFSGSFIQMDNAIVATLGSKTQFVVHMDRNGNFVWAQEAGHIDGSWVIDPAIDVDGDGNIFYTSCLENESYVGGERFFSRGGTDVCMAIFSPGGELLWTKRYGDTSFDFGYGVSCHANNEATFFGNFNNFIDFDGDIQMLAIQTVDVFLVRASFGNITSVKDEEAQVSVEYFPNPTTDILNITSSEVIDAYQVINLQGQVLEYSNGQDPASSIQVDVRALPMGSYVMKLMTKEGMLSLPFIKK